ncbi:MAG: heparinase II/III family protein, partial [Stellaceae bacterium]
EPRAAIKRRARRLINTAFLALTAERDLAEPALAATRSALAEFAEAASWKERPVIRSFLDCAEIAVAVALAYDWLYDELTGRERRAVERAIRRNVLDPALAAYEDPSLLWPKLRDNCALVSHAGILIAALSVMPRYRALSAELVRRSVSSAWNVFSAMAPDGAWREGLSYWSLAMRYACLMTAALESALGGSFGLAERPGFAQTGDFALHAAGPFGAAFNFGDSEQRYDVSPLAWFAHRYGRPIDGWLMRGGEGLSFLFSTIWPHREQASPAALDLPTGKVFHSSDLACFRNTWLPDPEARPVYLAIKGGNVATRLGTGAPRPEDITLHAQADAGTFVVDGARHRWLVDIGSDNYDLPGYFEHGADGRSGRRWRYYRSQSAGHNTLSIGGRDQIPNAPAAIVDSCVEGDSKWAVLDLSAAYGQPYGTIRRGAALLGRQMVVQDEIDPALGSEIVWTVHTAAEPLYLNGSVAHFGHGEDNFVVQILEPAGASFELSQPPPPLSFAPVDLQRLHGRALGETALVSELPRCADDDGRRAMGAPIRRLQIVLPPGTPRVTVLLLPDCDTADSALPVAPLDHWLARRPVRLSVVPRQRRRLRGSRAGEHRVATRPVKPKMRRRRALPQSRLDHA